MTTQPKALPARSALPVSVVHFPPHGRLSIDVLHTKFDWISLIATALLVTATIGLAYFTWRLWRATGKLVEDTEKSAQNQMRAYVGIEAIELNDLQLRTEAYQIPNTTRGDGMPHKIDVEMRNFGATPANRVDFIATIWIKSDPLPKDSELDQILDTEKMRLEHDPRGFAPRHSIFPEQTAPMHIYMSDLIAFREALLGQRRNVFVFGRIDYSDIFDAKRTTRFCYYFDKTREPGKEFATFSRYNESA